ncbi:uncharacterized protein LAESUDRAFT_225850 [Laetiporus sulphureus 93-53]|uniref:Uncharacterized protein n=1 Tax=Laetiporus sulphureus 93-53 TaxID=1314785 RepID=A0A165DPP7_9APHY|nr:uncharacterized protein LAESUDRAFT_225850 [Laetiporus sulphureus 93-53]KZT05352.1 hypothetical protein LAESUDRAFT_225850 [Laetiporus sulphureus 93-53]
MCVDEEPSREDKERTRIARRLEHAEECEDETSSQASDEVNGRERHFYLSNSERSYDSWNGQSKHGFYVNTAVRDIQKSREISKWRFRRARQLDPDFDGRDDLEDVWLRACKESDEVFGYEMTGRAHGDSYVTDNGKGGLPGSKEGEGKPERNREVDGKGVNEKNKKTREKDEGQGSHRRSQKDYITDDGLGASNRNEEWHELHSEHEDVVGQDGNNRHGSVNRGDEDSLHAPQGTYDEGEGYPHEGDPEAYEAESADLEDSPHLAVWGAKLDEEGRPYIEIDDDEDDDEDQSEENEGEGGDEEERSQHTGPQGEGEPQAIDVDDVDVQAGELQGSIGVTTAAASDSSVQIKPEPVSARINQQSGPSTGPRLDPTKRRVYLGEDGLPIIHGATDKEVRAILRSLTDRVDAFQKHDHTMDVMELVIDANDKTLKDMAKRLANMQRGRRAIERHFMEQMKKTPSLWDGSMSWMPPEEGEGAAHADQDIRMDGSSQQPNDEEARQSPDNIERPASPVQHLKRKRRSLYSSEWVRRAAIRDGFVPDDDPSIEDREQLREKAGMPAFMQPPVWALPEHSGSADFMNVEPRAADQSFEQTHKRSRSGGLSPEPRVPKRMKNDSGVSHMEPTFTNQDVDVDMQPAAEISLQNQQGDQAEEERVASRLPAEKAAGDADPSRVEPLSGDDDAEMQLAIQLSLQDQVGNPSGGNGSTSRSVEKMRADAVPPHPEVYSSGEDADMQAAIRLSLQEQHSGEALPGIRLAKESGARPFGTEAYSDQEDADYQAAIRLSLQELEHNYSVGESSRLHRALPIRTDASSSRLEPDLDKKALRIWREKHGKDAEPTLAEAVSIERAVMQGVSPENAVEHVGVAPTAPAEVAVGAELHKSPVAHRSERFMRWVEEEMEEKSLEDFLIYWEALFDITEEERTLVTTKQTATMADSSNENAAVKMREIIAEKRSNAVSGKGSVGVSG